MTVDLCLMSACELVDGYRARRFSPVEVTTAVLTRIDRLNDTFNAYCWVDGDRALDAARAAEARWQRGAPLGLVDGVPTSVKDLLFAKDWPTRRGSCATDPEPVDFDSASVARMREAGAVILGKTTTPEFGWKGVTDSPLTGVTVNPWNSERTPGGSSGGAAVAAAAGMGHLNIATDGGGSVRIPAGFTGLFGIKPTFGVVPVNPHSVMLNLWHQGPIVRTVRDGALMLTVLAGPEPDDWYAAPDLGRDFRDGLDDGIDRLRIGYSPDLGFVDVDPDVRACVDAAVEVLAELGAEIEQIDHIFDDPSEIMIPLWAVGIALGIDDMDNEKRALLEPEMVELSRRADSLTALDYRKLESARGALGQTMNRFHQTYDLLITPQLPITAFKAGANVPAGSGMANWWNWTPFTYPFNLTQQPAATMPCGLASDGMPVAMQIIGAKFDEPTVFRACRAYEQAHPIELPKLAA